MSEKTHKLASIFFRGGIRRWLLCWGLGLFGAALGLNTLAGSIYTRRQIVQSTAALQKEVAILTARHIQTYIGRKIERLHDAANGLTLYPIGNDEQTILTNLLLKEDGSFEEISIIDDRGRERLRISDRKVYFDADLRDLRDDVAYKTAIRGGSYVSPVFTSNRAEPYLLLAVPLTSIRRKIVGVIVAKTNMTFLWELMREEKFGHAGFMYLVNERGRLIANKDPLLVLENPDLMHIPKVAEFLTGSTNQIAGTKGIGLNGDDVLSTYAVVPDLGWAVIIEEPVAFALADLKKLELFTKTLMVAGLLMGFVIIVFLSNRITRPILKLRDGANIIEKGNLNHRVEIDTNDEIGELGAKFNQMAVALKNAQETLETKIKLRTRELSALYGVTTLINQSLDMATVLNYGIEQIAELFHFDTIRFFLYDRRFDTLTLEASYSTVQGSKVCVGPFRRGESVVGQVAESGEPVFFEDVQSDPRYFALSESKTTYTAGFHFFAALPIKTKTQTFGVAAFSSNECKQLNEHNAQSLNAICEHIAVAVEKTRLFEEVTKRSEALQEANEVLRNEVIERQRAQEEVSRQHQRISSLHKIGAAINSTLDRTLLLDALFARVKSVLPYTAASVCWYDRATDRLVTIAERNLAPELLTGGSGDAAESPVLRLSEMLVKQEDPMVIENVNLDTSSVLFEPFRKHGWTGFVGLPLSVEGKALGALAFYLRESHEFPNEEVAFLATLAGQVAIAIFNSELYENSRQQAIDLEKAIHAKDEFLNVMSHELRTPLSVIGGYVQALSIGIAGEISPEQRKITEKISFQSNELLRMINEILQVGSLQAGSVQAYFGNTNLFDLFRNLQGTFDALRKDSTVLIWDIPDDMPTVKTDGDKLKHILQNLIHNAMKFTEHGSVTISARCFHDSVVIAVKDTGIGIEKEKLPVIFDMFRQVDSSHTRSHGGVGVGLFIVKKYVELLNGKIEVESSPGHGTTFTLTIPTDELAEPASPAIQEQFMRLIA
jgi:signal transduction histidine kinase/HAMP domain-containing protein